MLSEVSDAGVIGTLFGPSLDDVSCKSLFSADSDESDDSSGLSLSLPDDEPPEGSEAGVVGVEVLSC